MAKGHNPKRQSKSQTNHDKIVSHIAKNLTSQGYSVLADHINWKYGAPDEINGYIPDILAEKDNNDILVEVETCSTYTDATHTKPQISAFNKSKTTYMIVPNFCKKDGHSYDPIPEAKETLKSWNLSSVRVGSCSLDGKTISYRA